MAIIDKKGILHGKVSNMVYRAYRGQQIAQIKPGKVKQTIETKEASCEFGLCSSTAKTFRFAFAHAYKAYDGGMVNRLVCRVREAVSSSMHKERGDRDIHDAGLQHLNGFQFNANSPLEKVLSVRPQVEFTSDNKIKIYLPAIKKADIKGPRADKYVVRFVGIGFNFKKEIYSYNSYREIEINHKQSWAGGEIFLDEGFANGRLVLLSMSIHGYTQDGYEGMDCINSVQWSPCEIVGAWHAHGELDDTQITLTNEGVMTLEAHYEGNKALWKIARLREKAQPRRPLIKSTKAKVKGSGGGFNFPKGDIPIN